MASSRNTTAGHAQLLEFDVRSGIERELFASSNDITYSDWMPDGSGILLTSRGFGSSEGMAATPDQLWLKPYPAGAPLRLTNDLVDYRKVSISADGKTLLAVGAEYQAAVYVVPLDGSAPRRVPSERSDGLLGVLQLKDDSLVVATTVAGQTQIIRLSADSATRTVLTTAGANYFPAKTPDESVIAMVSTRDGNSGIWRMKIDGSDQRLLTHLPAAARLSITPDGKKVIAMSYKGATSSVWSVPLDGSQAVEIARNLQRAVVSPPVARRSL